MRLLVEEEQQLDSDPEREMSAAAPAEYAEWVEKFFLELHSPESVVVTDNVERGAPGIISGVAQTSWGNPIEGIRVTATLREYFRANSSVVRASTKTEYNTTTNANGFFAFRDLPAGIYMVGVADSGFYSAARIEVHTGVKYVDLVLNPQRHAQIRGIVTDTMGRAIEDARIIPIVKGIPARVVSNTDGKFTLAVTVERESGGFPVRVQARGYRETRYEIMESDWTAGSGAIVNIVMEPLYEFGTVSGSVKDTAGLPAAGEIVRLYSSSLKRNYRAAADQGGEYEFGAVEPADDYQLWVRPVGPYRDFVAGHSRARLSAQRANPGPKWQAGSRAYVDHAQQGGNRTDTARHERRLRSDCGRECAGRRVGIRVAQHAVLLADRTADLRKRYRKEG
jgi:hypothetical protein